jgi:hypothetical protein
LEYKPVPEIQYAISNGKKHLPVDMHDFFELFCVCIGENTLTQELSGISRSQNINVSFKNLLKDHILDEGRHGNYFRQLLEYSWLNISDKKRQLIANALPYFVIDFLSNNIQKKIDKKILMALDFNSQEIAQIIKDTHIKMSGTILKKTNPIVTSIITLLKRTNILEHSYVISALQKHDLL